MAEMCQGNAIGGCKAKAKKGDLGEENSPAYMNGGRQRRPSSPGHRDGINS